MGCASLFLLSTWLRKKLSFPSSCIALYLQPSIIKKPAPLHQRSSNLHHHYQKFLFLLPHSIHQHDKHVIQFHNTLLPLPSPFYPYPFFPSPRLPQIKTILEWKREERSGKIQRHDFILYENFLCWLKKKIRSWRSYYVLVIVRDGWNNEVTYNMVTTFHLFSLFLNICKRWGAKRVRK